MLNLVRFAESVGGPDDAAMVAARARWNSIAKPIAGLGGLEDLVCQMAGLTGDVDVRLGRRAVMVMCADNGVVEQGVSQCGTEATTAVATNVARGASSVCRMCSPMGIDAFAVDMGMAVPADEPGIIDRSVARGTADITRGPAMTRDQALRGIQAGIELMGDLKGRGYGIVATGEMGIGNTTTSSAMASVLLDVPPEAVVGRGAGLSDEGLARKLSAIRRAIAWNRPDADDPLDVLSKLGGFDIAGIVGLFLGGALRRVPVVIDGLISMLAAYVATLLCPASACAMLPSHLSSEPAACELADRMGLDPPIHAGMHLGEGTGAVCLIPLLDMALSLYHGTTFEEMGIDAYEAGSR